MKEITSSYDDLEKRMAIYGGLGALLATSLYLLIQGADLWSYLIRGVLALAVATTVIWLYLHWLRVTVEHHTDEEELPENVHRQSRDAQSLEGHVVNHADIPDTVIPSEVAAGRVTEFAMPEFDMPMEPVSRMQVMAEEEGDLPPPPVPRGI